MFQGIVIRGTVVAATALTTAGCGNGGDPTPPDEVGTADAYSAIVRWEVEEQGPHVDDDGVVEQPVIFVATAGGGTIDVGVQATVVEDTVDIAAVSFADDPAEAVDDTEEGAPVRNDGVMYVVGSIPPAGRTIEVEAERYVSRADAESLTFTIVASPDGVAVREVDSD